MASQAKSAALEAALSEKDSELAKLKESLQKSEFYSRFEADKRVSDAEKLANVSAFVLGTCGAVRLPVLLWPQMRERFAALETKYAQAVEVSADREKQLVCLNVTVTTQQDSIASLQGQLAAAAAQRDDSMRLVQKFSSELKDERAETAELRKKLQVRCCSKGPARLHLVLCCVTVHHGMCCDRMLLQCTQATLRMP